jgi:hypothetical protein
MYHYTIEGRFTSTSELTSAQIDGLSTFIFTQIQEPVDICTQEEEEYDTSSIEIKISLDEDCDHVYDSYCLKCGTGEE